jgi:D-alanine-D-alanine ligase
MHAHALAEECDLVIDHTDTYCGRGLYRSFVRLLLENWGARIVGSPAKACFVADNKAAAKQLLADAGIPVPPGIVIQSNTWELPAWLKPPLVLKPAFEHMSRGVCLATTEPEAYRTAARLIETMRQPILVESYIPGRELAVSLIGTAHEIQVLPVLEWQSGAAILTEDFKVMDPIEAEHKTVRTLLDGELNRELEDLAQKAFQVLNLRDYARFDIRPHRAGTSFSWKPIPRRAWADGGSGRIGRMGGLDYAALINRLLSTARRRHARPQLKHMSISTSRFLRVLLK